MGNYRCYSDNSDSDDSNFDNNYSKSKSNKSSTYNYDMSNTLTDTTNLSKISKSSTYDSNCDSKDNCEDETPKTLIETSYDLDPKLKSNDTKIIGTYNTSSYTYRGQLIIKKDLKANIFVYDGKYKSLPIKFTNNKTGYTAKLNLGENGSLKISDNRMKLLQTHSLEIRTYKSEDKTYVSVKTNNKD
jgi:hypothetical protein